MAVRVSGQRNDTAVGGIVDRLEFTFHVSLTLLVLLAATVFSFAEAGFVPFLAVPVAIFSYFMVDRYRLLRLPMWVTNLLGVFAFAIAALEFAELSTYQRLLAGGHLLTYLTCVFLLSPKGDRQAWWLIALCHLQFALACLVGYDPWFGLVCPLYLLLTLWTLTVFYFARAAGITTRAVVSDAAGSPTSSEGTSRSTTAGSTSAEESTGEWSIAIRPKSFANGRSRIQVRPQAAGSWQIVTLPFAGATCLLTVFSLSLAVAVFFLTPREMFSGNASIFGVSSPLGRGKATTGFTENVSLGEVGEIGESKNIALEVELIDVATGRQVPVSEWVAKFGPPRFRGAVMESYSRGTWQRRNEVDRRPVIDLTNTRLPVPGGVKQRIQMLSKGSMTLLSWGTPIHVEIEEGQHGVYLDSLSQTLEQASRQRGNRTTVEGEFEYTVEVVPFHMTALPINFGGDIWSHRDLTYRVQRYLDASSVVSNRLHSQLDAWMDEQPFRKPEQQSDSAYERALMLESFLRDSPEFSYSLSRAVDDPGVDPVIDFLVNRKQGHCEYFATALALMLRLEGIPSRLVSGYSGGEINPTTGKLEVRDLHAHAWVEAFITDAPPDPKTNLSGPRWIVLDATPSARDALVQQQAQDAVAFWPSLRDGWRTFWNNSIAMDRGMQHQTIYRPLRDSVIGAWDDAQALLQGKSLPDLETLKSPSKWFSLKGGVVTFGLLLLLLSICWCIRRLFGRKRPTTAKEEGIHGPAVIVAFYERLNEILQRLQLVREPQSTPLEFAAAVAERLPSDVATTPRDVTEVFYNVRFGHASLSVDEARQIDDRLNELEASVVRCLQSTSGRPMSPVSSP